jgi:hypothetical protein
MKPQGQCQKERPHQDWNMWHKRRKKCVKKISSSGSDSGGGGGSISSSSNTHSTFVNLIIVLWNIISVDSVLELHRRYKSEITGN